MKMYLRIFVAIQLAFTPMFASGQSLSLSKHISARVADGNNILQSVGHLGPGSVVKVPTKKEIHKDDEELVEKELLSWLSRTGEIHQFQKGERILKDYFYPVEVVTAKNSMGIKKGDIVFISIRYLVKRNGIHLEVTEKAEMQAKVPKKEFDRLKRHLKFAFKKLERKTKINLDSRRGPASGIARLDKTCPLNFEQFLPEVKLASDVERVPMELLLATMQVESAGRCFAVRKELDGSRSVGLFQVNTKSTSIPLCNKSQIRAIKGAKSVDELLGLRCLHNPVYNIGEAARILRDKYTKVNSQSQPAFARWSDLDKESRDGWRKALSAYNGGQAYVYQAYRDIKSFNRVTGSKLDPDNWEHRRVFFFRRWLKRDIQRKVVPNRLAAKRSLRNSLINVSYVESIVGREDSAQNSMIHKWEKQLAASGTELSHTY